MFNVEEMSKYICYFTNCIEDPQKLVNEIELSNDDQLIKRQQLTQWSNWAASNAPEDIYGQNMFTRFSVLEEDVVDKRTKYIVTEIKKAFFSCSEMYKEKYNFPYEVNLDDEFGIKKYNVGQGLGPHADQYDGNMRLRFSLVLYLNDDYEGGELWFPNHNIEIKPKPGSLAIFPAYEPFLHASKDILSGVKYMCPAFWMNTGRWEKGKFFLDELEKVS